MEKFVDNTWLTYACSFDYTKVWVVSDPENSSPSRGVYTEAPGEKFGVWNHPDFSTVDPVTKRIHVKPWVLAEGS